MKNKHKIITRDVETQKFDLDLNDSNIIKKQYDNNNISGNKGNLILDATIAPSDIKYPTDVNLLNSSREVLEEIIDIFHEPDIGAKNKSRTYRKRARKKYLAIEKKKKISRCNKKSNKISIIIC